MRTAGCLGYRRSPQVSPSQAAQAFEGQQRGASCLRPEVDRAVSSCRKEALDTESCTHSLQQQPRSPSMGDTNNRTERGHHSHPLADSLSLENKFSRSVSLQNTRCKICRTKAVLADHDLIWSPSSHCHVGNLRPWGVEGTSSRTPSVSQRLEHSFSEGLWAVSGGKIA